MRNTEFVEASGNFSLYGVVRFAAYILAAFGMYMGNKDYITTLLRLLWHKLYQGWRNKLFKGNDLLFHHLHHIDIGKYFINI